MKKIFFVMVMFAFVQVCKAKDIWVTAANTTVTMLYNKIVSDGGPTGPTNIADLGGRTLRFEGDGNILGSGTIKNGSIDASFYQNIFDASLTLTNLAPSRQYFSACWFGAKGDQVTESAAFIQRAINICLGQTVAVPLFIPPGTYKISQSLNISSPTGLGAFKPVNFHMFGGGQFMQGLTALNYMGTAGTYALGIQDGVGVEVNSMRIAGLYNAPSFSANPLTYNIYYFTTLANYNDLNSACTDDYAGIVIDPASSTRGSTGIKIHDMYIAKFAVDLLVSPSASTHSDLLVFENIQVENSKWGIRAGSSGSKGNVVRGLYTWGSMHTLISLGRTTHGCGSWTFDGGNVANACIRLFDIVDDGWYPIKIRDYYCERLGTVGSILITPPPTPPGSETAPPEFSEPPVYVERCDFELLLPYPTQQEVQIALQTSIGRIRFESCSFRYYSGSIPGNTIFMVTDDPSLLASDPAVWTGNPTENAAFTNCAFQGYLWLNRIITTTTTPTVPLICTDPNNTTGPNHFPCYQDAPPATPTIFIMN